MQPALSTTSLLTGFSFGQERLKKSSLTLDLILDMAAEAFVALSTGEAVRLFRGLASKLERA